MKYTQKIDQKNNWECKCKRNRNGIHSRIIYEWVESSCTLQYTNFLEKFAQTFAFFPVTRTCQEPKRKLFRKTSSDELFVLDGFFRADFLL